MHALGSFTTLKKALGVCCLLEKGKSPIQKTLPGEYPMVVTSPERKTSDTYQFEGPAVCVPLISSRGHGVAAINQIFYQEGKFALGNILCGIKPCDYSEIDAKYLCYYLNKKKDTLIVPLMKGGANVSITVDTLKKIKIELPPIDIQKEIVRILDTFTEAQANLEQELELRKKQYEYYRNQLLTFDENDSSVKWMKLSNCSSITRGKRVVKKDLKETGNIPVYQNSLAPLGYFNVSNYSANTAFVISAGAAGEVGFSSIPYWGADDCLSVVGTELLDGKFSYHWLKIKEVYLKSQIRGGAIKRLSRDVVENLEIPVPSKERQQEIVTILDKFESAIQTLEEELALRKKQYEYYREKLLTFN